MRKTAFIIYIFFVAVLYTHAQSVDIIEKMRKKYPQARVVQLEDKTIVEVSVNPTNGKLNILNKVYEKQLYLSDRASLYSDRSISYNSFIEVQNIKATVYVPGEKKYTSVKVKDFKVKDDLGGSTFKDDTRKITFRYPGLQNGAVTELYYEEKVSEPRFLTSFYFGNYRPVENSEFVIIADNSIHIDFKKFNMDTFNYHFSKEEKKGKIYYRFTAKNIPEFDSEADAPNIRYYVPHVIPIIRTYTFKGKEIPVLRNVADLYHWYYSLLKNINKNLSPELKNLTDSVTKNAVTEIDITKAIYYWVQKNIKYVAFEEGLGGFIPREADDVCKKRYGDCKDNSSLLVAMLRYKGIRVYYTWIGTRDIPYTYEEVPTPLADNHMICTVEINGKYFYLDATGNHHPLGLPSSFIQGKEALIGIDSVHYDIDVVPIVPPKNNAFTDTVKIKLDGDKIYGNGKAEINGYLKVDAVYGLDEVKNKTDEKDLVKDLIEKGNNKFYLHDFNISNKNIDSPLEITYHFSIEDYVQQVDNEYYVNLNLEQDAAQLKIHSSKKYDLEIDNTLLTKTTVEFQIPEGYELAYLPKNSSQTSDLIDFSINYSVKENTVVYKHYFKIKKLLVKKNQFTEWNSIIQNISKQYREVMILKKKQ
jgi:hypothetical protein